MRRATISSGALRCTAAFASLWVLVAMGASVAPMNDWRIGLLVSWRLLRNAMLPNTPADVPLKYAPCSPTELVEQITVVVTAKDTCSQTPQTFAELTHSFPRDMRMVYVYPAYPGCNRSLPEQKLFKFLQLVEIPSTSSPNDGFLQAASAITTPYALLMHNDVTPLDGQRTVCELYRALSSRPALIFAAPQIYERSDNGIMVPHAHFRHLHRTPQNTVRYDLDWDIITKRRPHDFSEGEQPDFLEDHAYLARSEPHTPWHYSRFLDADASFTMEYLDSILNLRAQGAPAPWYVPSARVLFDVSVRRMQYNDLPYFSFKRSEEVGLRVRAYLDAKWTPPSQTLASGTTSGVRILWTCT